MRSISKRTPEQELADRAERERRSKAFWRLMDSARLVPDRRYPAEKIASRSGRPIEEVQRILDEYDNAPHVHAIRTMHWFNRPCRLGKEHIGCCPRERGCDEAGVLPLQPA